MISMPTLKRSAAQRRPGKPTGARAGSVLPRVVMIYRRSLVKGRVSWTLTAQTTLRKVVPSRVTVGERREL